MTTASAGLETSAFAPLRSAIFRGLFIAQIFSNLGTLMQGVGTAWLMGDLGASPTLIAMVQTATLLPVVFVGVPAGALADLLSRRKILIVSHVLMMISAALMAALVFIDHISPLGLLALTFVLGTGMAVMGPAWLAIQPTLVPREHLPQAMALGSMTMNGGRAVGPAIGGVIVAAAGPEWVFLLNAVSFVGTLGVLIFWRESPAASDGLPREDFANAMMSGLRYCWHSPGVRAAAIRGSLLATPAGAVGALLPIVVRDSLGWTSGGYGVLLTCYGIGFVIGVVLRPQFVRRLSRDKVMAAGSLVMAAMLIVQGLVVGRLVMGLALGIAGVAWSLASTEVMVAAQAVMPDWVRARGMAVNILVQAGGFALGSAAWGAIAGFSLFAGYAVPAVVLCLSAAGGIWWSLNDLTMDLELVPSPQTEVAFRPAYRDGPVQVTNSYRVSDDSADEFTSMMLRVENHRKGLGAYRWMLFRDLDEPDRYVETYLVATWADLLRQNYRRTASATEWLDRLKPFAEGTEAKHLLAVGLDRTSREQSAVPPPVLRL